MTRITMPRYPMKKNRFPLVSLLLLLLTVSSCAFTPISGQGIPRAATPTRAPINTAQNVHLLQSFDYRIQDPTSIARYYDFVWGASPQKVAAFRAGNPNIRLSYYISFFRDSGVFSNLAAHQELAYWKATHPDWILYQCDRTTPAYEDGQTDIVPLDFSQPELVKWQVQNYALPASQYGYDALAADNLNIENLVGACGSYKNGQWVQRYSGETNDPQWRADVLTWATRMQTALHALPHPLALIPNVGYGSVPLNGSYMQQLINRLDGVLDEGGFTKYGHGYITDTNWLEAIRLIQSIQQQRKPYYLVNELPSLNRADIQWALSSYLLANEQSAFLSISGVQDYGRDLRYSEYSDQIGSPQGEMYQDQKMYWRNYTRALVVVNPSSTQTFTAQLFRQYVDLYGNPLGKTITLSPHSGMVLLKMK